MTLDPKIWGPHYWFVLHTIALSYPKNPNEVTKKKYYDFIQNIPLFIPIEDIGNTFSKLIDKYPVTPYLDSRESFIRWMHYVHNKINVALLMPELTMEEAMTSYYNNYKPMVVKDDETRRFREKIVFLGVISVILLFSAVLYNK
jgi:hypothetical protein